MKVLVVEDDIKLAQALGRILEESDTQSIWCMTAQPDETGPLSEITTPSSLAS